MTTITIPLYAYFNRKINGIWSTDKFAEKRKLSFSKQEELGDDVIALDTEKRKLLYFKSSPHLPSCLIIDLKNLSSCTIKKQYHSIDAGDLKKKKLQDYLKSVFLHLGFKNSAQVVALSFYEEGKEKKADAVAMETKAGEWRTIFSKLLPMH